jgi:hypothetical protein
MEDPWFGKRGNDYTGGPVNFKGWAALVVCVGGAIAAYKLLPFPGNFLGAGACLMVLVLLGATKYDPDSESW